MNQLFALSLGIAAMAFATSKAQPLFPAAPVPFAAQAVLPGAGVLP